VALNQRVLGFFADPFFYKAAWAVCFFSLTEALVAQILLAVDVDDVRRQTFRKSLVDKLIDALKMIDTLFKM
jgi:hypothetical protein